MRVRTRIFRRGLAGVLFVGAIVAGAAPGAAQPAPGGAPRIALVIGESSYRTAPLATTANDAGLIAETLQAAGFDVVGAADLDGDTLRKSFRDFIQKAVGFRPGTVWRWSTSPVMACSSPAKTISYPLRFHPAEPRHRHSDRGVADQRLSAPACSRFR